MSLQNMGSRFPDCWWFVNWVKATTYSITLEVNHPLNLSKSETYVKWVYEERPTHGTVRACTVVRAMCAVIRAMYVHVCGHVCGVVCDVRACVRSCVRCCVRCTCMCAVMCAVLCAVMCAMYMYVGGHVCGDMCDVHACVRCCVRCVSMRVKMCVGCEVAYFSTIVVYCKRMYSEWIMMIQSTQLNCVCANFNGLWLPITHTKTKK